MHAWPGCPEAAATLELGSIQQMEAGGYDTCPVCGFTAASMGTVAAASTSIDNGFEYHYDAVANEAAIYESARHRADGPKNEVKSKVGEYLEELAEIMSATVGKRIHVNPPGRYGAVALVVNSGSMDAAGPFGERFVTGSATLGPRAAISASTLVDEGTDEGSTIITSLLDSLAGDAGAASGVAGIVLGCWSWLLTAYAGGQDALTGAVENGLGALPLASESGLGSWAADALRWAIEAVGLEPAELGALKPVLVNSAHVAAKDDGAFGGKLVALKQAVYAHPLMSTDLFGSLLTGAEQSALTAIDNVDGIIHVAAIELMDSDGNSIPVDIAMPEPVRQTGVGFVTELFATIRSFYIQTTGVRIWE